MFALIHPSIHPSMYAFKKYLSSNCYAPDAGDSVKNKTGSSFTPESYTPSWQTVIEQVIKVLLVLQRRQQLSAGT